MKIRACLDTSFFCAKKFALVPWVGCSLLTCFFKGRKCSPIGTQLIRLNINYCIPLFKLHLFRVRQFAQFLFYTSN